MKRAALVLTGLAILFVTANAAFARGYHHGPNHGHYYGYRGAVVAPPPVLAGRVLTGPTMLVQPPPRVYYRPAPYYRPYYAPVTRYYAPVPRYYAPAPRYNFYYQNRGLSLGIGF